MAHPRSEIESTMARYLEVRAAIDAGNGTWADLAQFFTEDAVFIDPAWGRVEGLDEMRRTVFGDAMDGLEEWKFPVDFWTATGDTMRRVLVPRSARREASVTIDSSSPLRMTSLKAGWLANEVPIRFSRSG